MHVLKKIQQNYLKRKEKNSEKLKEDIKKDFSIKNKLMLFIPFLDIFSTLSIMKKFKKYDFVNSEIMVLSLLMKFFINLGIIMSILFLPINGFLLAFMFFTLFSSFLQVLEITDSKLKLLIEDLFMKNNLEKEDFKYVKENMDEDVLSIFMAKNDFKITYNDIDKLINESDFAEKNKKAKEILITMSESDIKETIKI